MQIQTLFNSHPLTIKTEDDQIWFVANDLCSALSINNPRDALARLDDDEKGVVLTDTLGGLQKVNAVTESGMYSLVLSSRKAEAKAFKRWITHEVLPTLRRTGTYTIKISPAQAQTLKEKVQLIVDSGKQKHGETWARFQRKFRVNSYLELPVSRFDDACAYLDGKMDSPVKEALGHLANAVAALAKEV